MLLLLLFALLALPVGMKAQMKAVLYLSSEPPSVRSFLAHADKISIVVPTFYSADEQGALRGSPDTIVLEGASKHRVPVMPIVVNPGFKQETIHGLLGNPKARERLSQGLLEECRRHRYYGIQLDFENVPAADRSLLTALVRETSAALGKEGFKLSIAAMHQTGAEPGPAPYARWLWENWLGAYDLREIAAHAEFISVMTYDQHTERTPPGPIAGFPWVAEALDHCLTLIPKEKLSLGIPLYGRRWFAGVAGKEAAPLTATVHAHEAAELAAKMNAAPQWDATERAPWFSFSGMGCGNTSSTAMPAVFASAGSWPGSGSFTVFPRGCWAQRIQRSGRTCRRRASERYRRPIASELLACPSTVRKIGTEAAGDNDTSGTFT